MVKNFKYSYICSLCGKSGKSNQPNTRLCSDECRNKFYQRNSNYTGLASGTVGAIAELIVSSDLLKEGYAVFRSVSSNCFADLIAIKNEEIRYLEVRTGYKGFASGKITFPKMIHHKNGRPTEYAVWVESEKKVHYIPITKELFEKYKTK